MNCTTLRPVIFLDLGDELGFDRHLEELTGPLDVLVAAVPEQGLGGAV